MKKAKKSQTPQKPAKWYAPTKVVFARLEALGAPRKDIFEGWLPAQHWTKVKMREGESLGVVDGYRAFGNGKRIITKAVDRFHEQKATIVDFETHKNSRDHGHILMPEALSNRHVSAEHRRKMADEAAEARRVAKGGLTDHEIELIWKTPGIASTDERAEQIGIPRSTLYAKLKRSGAMSGRRPKHLLEAWETGLAEVFTINLERRDDGGMRVEGPRPGSLILSGSDPETVMAKIWPALVALNHPVTKFEK